MKNLWTSVNLLVLLCLASCRKDGNEDLIVKNPPLYSEGRGDGFGCKLDGTHWWANVKGAVGWFGHSTVRNPLLSYGGRGTSMQIVGIYYADPSQKKGYQGITFLISNVSDTGLFDIGNTSEVNTIEYRGNGGSSLEDTCRNVSPSAFILPYEGQLHFGRGQVHITYLPRDKKYVSGRFWADLCRPGCDTIRIRDGVFDLKY